MDEPCSPTILVDRGAPDKGKLPSAYKQRKVSRTRKLSKRRSTSISYLPYFAKQGGFKHINDVFEGVQNLENMSSKDGVIYGYVSPNCDRLFIQDIESGPTKCVKKCPFSRILKEQWEMIHRSTKPKLDMKVFDTRIGKCKHGVITSVPDDTTCDINDMSCTVKWWYNGDDDETDEIPPKHLQRYVVTYLSVAQFLLTMGRYSDRVFTGKESLKIPISTLVHDHSTEDSKPAAVGPVTVPVVPLPLEKKG